MVFEHKTITYDVHEVFVIECERRRKSCSQRVLTDNESKSSNHHLDKALTASSTLITSSKSVANTKEAKYMF